jgi:hypothetical protein
MTTGVIVRKKFADLDFVPICASLDIEGNEKKWAVEIPVEQGKAMEADGFDIGWVYSHEPWDKARELVQQLKGILG